jgi:hypothetical protein
VDFSHGDPRNFSPGFICVGVVVQKLVSEHQSYRQKPKLASTLTTDSWIELLEPVDKEQTQQNHILPNLGSAQDSRDPFPETGWRYCISYDASIGRCVHWKLFGVLQSLCALEPE